MQIDQKYQWYFKIGDYGEKKGLALIRNDYDGSSYAIIEKGVLTWVKIEDRQVSSEPLFICNGIEFEHPILVQLANLLAQHGFYPEVDNAERIAAKAVADERKEHIDYMRSFCEKMVFNPK